MKNINFALFEEREKGVEYLELHSSTVKEKDLQKEDKSLEELFGNVNKILILGIKRIIVPENVRGPIVTLTEKTFLDFIFKNHAEIRPYLGPEHLVFFDAQLRSDFKTTATATVKAFVDFGTREQKEFSEEGSWRHERV